MSTIVPSPDEGPRFPDLFLPEPRPKNRTHAELTRLLLDAAERADDAPSGLITADTMWGRR